MHEGPGSVAAHLEERVVKIPVFLESKTGQVNLRETPQLPQIKIHTGCIFTCKNRLLESLTVNKAEHKMETGG